MIVQQNRVGVQSLLKQFGLFNLLFVVGASSLGAESFEDFKHSQVQSFTQYRDARDSAFSNYLKSEWKEYQAQESQALYTQPKPKSITPAVEKKMKSVGPKVTIQVMQPPRKKERHEEVKKEKIAKKDIEFVFFGNSIGINRDAKMAQAKFYPQNQKGISNFFQTIASSDYDGHIQDIQSIKKSYRLNDWGLYLLVEAIAKRIYDDPNEQKLYEWFVFNKLGYDVKVGLHGSSIVLMEYSKKIIYSTPSYSFGKKKYYVMSHYAKSSVGSLYTYKQNYPDADRAFDLSLDVLPNFKENLKKRTLSFQEFGKRYSTTFEYNQNLVDFMATYPQADYETFFNTPLSEESYNDIARDMKKYINGKPASEALNFVLHFVQKAFGYERDQEQFGHEKVMFAEETLYYDKSDCEDRAVLFAYLVKKLFGMSVVGVKYKDHITTALHIPMQGDSVKENGRRFVIADPTYINANIGQSMPQYRSIQPESFIVVQKRGS